MARDTGGLVSRVMVIAVQHSDGVLHGYRGCSACGPACLRGVGPGRQWNPVAPVPARERITTECRRPGADSAPRRGGTRSRLVLVPLRTVRAALMDSRLRGEVLVLGGVHGLHAREEGVDVDSAACTPGGHHLHLFGELLGFGGERVG